MSEGWVKGRVRAGWLIAVHRGVYAVGHAALSRRGHWLGAVLACGERAVLSHGSAAALWKIRRPQPGDIHVTVRTTAGIKKHEGIVRHRSRAMRDEEHSIREGIPVTSLERTILDLAPRLPARQVERVMDEAVRLRLTDHARLAAYADDRRGHHGRGRTLRILASHEIGSTLTRTELEERFLALVRDQELSRPLVNATVLDLTVDFLWPQAGLVVELDGRESHLTPAAFEADRDRDSRLLAAGYRVMRFTWRQIVREPKVVANRVRRAL
jgi:very-short-patch-repair endonuclease